MSQIAEKRGGREWSVGADSVLSQMNDEVFCRQSSVIVVIGKGGVGKSTVSATLAKLAANAGLDVLVTALDDSGHLNRLFGSAVPLTNEETVLVSGETSAGGKAKGRIRGRLVTADVALSEYLAEHNLGAIARKIVDAGALDVIATAAPGVRELLVLAKIKQLERDKVADLIILDAPATGHAMTLLSTPAGLADAARGGPLRSQAEEVVEFLSNGARCQILLVTIPEETPVSEVIETAYKLEDSAYVALGPVVINGCYPVLSHLDADPIEAALAAGVVPPTVDDANRMRRAAQFRAGRQQLQMDQCERLKRELPLPQIRLPYLFTDEVGEEGLARLTSVLKSSVEAL